MGSKTKALKMNACRKGVSRGSLAVSGAGDEDAVTHTSPALPAACTARRSLKTNLCKWCDSTAPACEDKVCYSNCNLNSYCEDPYEICVAIW